MRAPSGATAATPNEPEIEEALRVHIGRDDQRVAEAGRTVLQRMKLMRKNSDVQPDVLVMTATPIPRTLHLALAGLRDLTLIETPPRDRSPIVTVVEPWDDELLEEALARELDRGGQTYFVHNRIETIEAIAGRVRRLTPRARVAVAHGQLTERALDEAMRRFVRGEVDVLVSTLIVESGLDVPNANTITSNRADQLGLGQLYQLRGRVGRGQAKSTCLLLYHGPLGETAKARLKTLRETDDGFVIAEEDLRLRGAGELLGVRQSGMPEFRIADLTAHGELLAVARDDAKLILTKDPSLRSERGEALRVLLYLFERDEAVRYLRTG